MRLVCCPWRRKFQFGIYIYVWEFEIAKEENVFRFEFVQAMGKKIKMKPKNNKHSPFSYS